MGGKKGGNPRNNPPSAKKTRGDIFKRRRGAGASDGITHGKVRKAGNVLANEQNVQRRGGKTHRPGHIEKSLVMLLQEISIRMDEAKERPDGVSTVGRGEADLRG